MRMKQLFNGVYIALFTIIMVIFVTQSCVHEPLNPSKPKDEDSTKNTNGIPCDPDTVYFENTILPLIQSSCAKSGCHDEITKEEEIVLTSYENILKTGEVKAGKADDSKLFEVLTEKDDKLMPPKSDGGPLSQDQINLIKTWINQGAKNNKCKETGCDTSAVSFSKNVVPIFKSYCQGCHNNSLQSGYVNLEGYDNVKTVVDAKRLLPSLRHKSGYSAMPQGGAKLDECKLRTITLWIENGAQNN